MILPMPEGNLSWHRRPMTWALVAANIFIFVLLEGSSAPTLRTVPEEDLRTAGRLFLQYRESRDPSSQVTDPSWVSQLETGNAEHMEFLGAYAIRNQSFHEFMKSSPKLVGDDVAIGTLQSTLHEFRDRLEQQPVARYGLGPNQGGEFSLVTYQFVHAGFLHLLSNLLFIVLMGIAIERCWGGLGLLFLYVGGGMAGGLMFQFLNPTTLIPMVGASGSASALLAFYAAFEPRRRSRYFFFLLPMHGQNGFLYLPTLLIIPLYLISDLSGWLATPDGLVSGVAYTAHLGGALFGLTTAMICRYLLRMKADWGPEPALVEGPASEPDRNTSDDEQDWF